MQITDSYPPVSSPRDSRPRRIRLAAAVTVCVAALVAAVWFAAARPIRPPAPKVVPYSALL